jgi:AraC family transcriptional regulator
MSRGHDDHDSFGGETSRKLCALTLRRNKNRGARVGNDNRARIERAEMFAKSENGLNASLSDLADCACMSRFHFARVFRDVTGKTPMEYVLEQKIACAKRKLADGRCSIATVAVSCGFSNQSHLTRVFKRSEGETPAQFKRRQE